MKITLIQPAMGHESSDYVRSWQMEPLSIPTLAGLTPDHHDVTFYDDRLEPIPVDEPTDLVGITVETYTARRAYQIAENYRKRGVPVVFGGFHPTLLPDEASRFADAIVVGSAEQVWPQLLSDFENGQLQSVYRGCIDDGPLTVRPRREIMATKNYLPLTLVESGRGCKFACDFCSIAAAATGKYGYRDPKEVAAEIEAAGRKYVFIVDDNLTANAERCKALLRELAPLNIRWMSQASIRTTEDPELLDLLEKSGCIMLLVGFESLSTDTLRAMNKKFNRDPDYFAQAIAKFRDHGIKLYSTFVFGYDTDTPDLIDRTLEFALEQRFFVAAFNHVQPFPGTPLYARMAEEGRLLHDRWWLEPSYNFGQIVYRPKNMGPDELFERLHAARRRFYGYPSILKRALEFRANINDFSSIYLHFTINMLLRRELRDKWKTPIGDLRAPNPDLSVLDGA